MTRKRGRGGPRQATAGKQYTNRTDLQLSPQRASKAMPAPQPPRQMQGGGMGGALPSINAPTQRPNEPITAGLPMGNGPGPEALQVPPSAPDSLVAKAAALYRAFPNEDTRRLLAQAQAKDPLYNTTPTPRPQRPQMSRQRGRDNLNLDQDLSRGMGWTVPMPIHGGPDDVDNNYGTPGAHDTWGTQRPTGEA
jgi:hypothetical protein